MARPSVIFFGYDGSKRGNSPKIYLRTLLFSTAHRGILLESFYVRLSRNESRQNFSVWVYGEKNLARGSGLFIPNEGVVANHHFLLPPNETSFNFLAGVYCLEVFGRIVGRQSPQLLFKECLSVDTDDADALSDPCIGVYFDWAPEASRYLKHRRRQSPPRLGIEDLKDLGLFEL
jgi:hypothetical protein